MENQEPKKKSKHWAVILIIIILFITALVFWRIFLKEKKDSEQKLAVKTQGTGQLKPAEKVEMEKGREVSILVTSAGGTISTRGADGTLYSLTIPPDAVILPTTVTLAPLTKLPVENYPGQNVSPGVYVGPEGKNGMTFIRPVFLTIKPNTPMPEMSDLGAAPFGRCNIGSRGFDPEICEAEKNMDFGAGVEPEKTVVLAKNNERTKDLLLFNPTVPIGEENTYVTELWETGSYVAGKINKEQLVPFMDYTFSGPSDYPNRTELLTHYAALGGDLGPYKNEINRMGRDKRDYPREVLKGAILADLVGDDEAANLRIEALNHVLTRNVSDIRGSFLPWQRYAAFLKVMQKTKNITKEVSSSNYLSPFINNAFAQGESGGAMADSRNKILGKMDFDTIANNLEQNANQIFLDNKKFASERIQAAETLGIVSSMINEKNNVSSGTEPNPVGGAIVTQDGNQPGNNSPGSSSSGDFSSGNNSSSGNASSSGSGSQPATPSDNGSDDDEDFTPMPPPDNSVPVPTGGNGSSGGSAGSSGSYASFAEKCGVLEKLIPSINTLVDWSIVSKLITNYNCKGLGDALLARLQQLHGQLDKCKDLVHKDLSNYGQNGCESIGTVNPGDIPVTENVDVVPSLAPLPGSN